MWSVQFSQRRIRHAGRGKPELLAAAAKVIAKRGLSNTRFTDIADATGVAVSTLQYLFGSREDLVIAILEYATQESLHQLREIAEETSDPRERLARLIVHSMGQPDDSHETWLLSMELSHAALRDPEVRPIYAQAYEARLAILRSTLQDGMRQGVFPSTLSAYDASAQILAVIDGFSRPPLDANSVIDAARARQLVIDTIASALSVELSLPETA
jgi:AcrR family transcriptional regulator